MLLTKIQELEDYDPAKMSRIVPNNQGERNPRYLHGKRMIVRKKCPVCNKYFYGFGDQKTCSQICAQSNERNAMWRGGKLTVVCEACGREIRRWPSELKGKHRFCSIICRNKNQTLYFSGEKSPFWKNCDHKFYRHNQWQTFRKRYLLQYEKLTGKSPSCLGCGAIKNLQLHHIIPRRKREDTIFFDFRYMLLCVSCHRKVEGKTIEEQFAYIDERINKN